MFKLLRKLYFPYLVKSFISKALNGFEEKKEEVIRGSLLKMGVLVLLSISNLIIVYVLLAVAFEGRSTNFHLMAYSVFLLSVCFLLGVLMKKRSHPTPNMITNHSSGVESKNIDLSKILLPVVDQIKKEHQSMVAEIKK